MSNKCLGYVLCISTSKQVLRTPFAGQNQFFDAKTTFSVTKWTKWRKKKRKPHKNMQKHAIKEESTSKKVLLLYAGWHPKAGWLLREIFICSNCFSSERTKKDLKVVLESKEWFRPENGVRSIPSLVEIHNISQSNKLVFVNWVTVDLDKNYWHRRYLLRSTQL